jgi:hypothetical protein
VAKSKKFDRKKEIKAIARERVGSVPAARVIEPKTTRRKPKHKKPVDVSGQDI